MILAIEIITNHIYHKSVLKLYNFVTFYMKNNLKFIS